MTSLPLRLLACVAAGFAGAPVTPLSAQSVPIARANGAAFDLWAAPANGGPATLALEGVSFRPLALAGATFRDHLRSDLPIEAGATSPAPHIRLPGGGSLFLADLPGATALLQVHTDGTLSIACTVPAGAGGGALLPAIAVRADGLSALVAQPLANGGDVLLVDLPAGRGVAAPPRVLTETLPPLSIVAGSLRLSDTTAFFIADAGLGAGPQLLRVALTAGPASQAVPVALGLPAGSTLLPETVLSADGRSLLLLGQVPGGLRHVLAIRPDGSPQVLTPAPVTVDTPALASPVGPLLALSPDGTVAAWRATVAGSKEIFLQPVPQPVPLPPPPAQLTANAWFTDTLDNAGILGFTAIGGVSVLTFVAGEAALDGTVGAADLFTAQLSGGGGPVLQNATQTSGLSVPPFLVPGELEIRSVVLDPRGERLLFTVDPQGGDAALLVTAADGSTPGTQLLPPFAAEPVLARAGDSVLILSVATTTAAGTTLHLLRPVGAPGPALQLLGTAPKGLLLDRLTDGAGGARAALVLQAGPAAPSLQLPLSIDVATGAVLPAWGQLYQVSPLLALLPSGALAAGVGDPGGPYLFAAFTGFNAGAVLKAPVGFGFPLPY